MTDDVFSSESVTDPAPSQPTDPKGGGEGDSVLDQLVGEGKKYKTPEELARARIEADQFIERLKEENAKMREDLGTYQTKAEEYERILKDRQEPSGEQPPETSGDQVKPEEIAALVDETIKERERKQSKEQNLQTAQEELVSQFDGDLGEARKFLQKRATELNVSVEYLKEQATESPTVFKELVGKKPESKPATPSAASLPSGNPPASGEPREGTWAYYENLRKTDPKKYWSPAVQNRMHQDAKEKGADFYK